MAQGNLVPNPSFEIKSGCPNTSNQVYLATGWINPTGGSPDYFDTCGSIMFNVPDNYVGSQNAHSGSAYPGLAVNLGWYREYIQALLDYSMTDGQTYCVSFYVSAAGHCDFLSIAPQLYISDSAIGHSSATYLPYSPQVLIQGIVYDTTNWILISGEYVAHGGEHFVTIGNFFDEPNTPYDSIGNTPNPSAYFYIDDVSIYQKITADAGNDQTICLGDSIQIGPPPLNGVTYRWNTSAGLSDSTAAQPFAKPRQTTTYYLSIADTGNLYCAGTLTDSVTITVNDCTPPPVYNVPTVLLRDELFVISALPAHTVLELYDGNGRKVLNDGDYQNNFSAVHLAAGIYFYRLYFTDGTSQRGEICVVK
jgi:hypothetical protein